MAELTEAEQKQYKFHHKEFSSRGLSDAECKRLALAVVNRDKGGNREPLELSASEKPKLVVQREKK